jgi:glutamate carboxypeptidase
MPGCFLHERIASPSTGDHHIFTHVRPGKQPILLVGHLDTLCPEDSAFRCLAAQGEKLVGPGVNDMKGGDVTLVWALKALESCCDISNCSIVCIFNGDEEIGSPASSKLFTDMKDKARAAFVFECGGPNGTVVTTRRGLRRYRLHITGQPNHFGNLKGAKASAVQELAAKILAVEALNGPDKAVVLNVGRVDGGLASNIVPERATMDFEFRFWEESEDKKMLNIIPKVALVPTVPGCNMKLELLSYRPPMKPTPASVNLFKKIVSLGSELGQDIKEEKRGGVSDACWFSSVGVPTLDGLGPLGDKDCTPEEYIIAETLFQRIELAAHLMLVLEETDKRSC